MSSKSVISLLKSAVLLTMLSGLSYGQSTAEITGRVTDSTGAIIPAVQIVVTNVDRETVRQTTSGDVGYYTFTRLEPGNYAISVESEGFKSVSRPGIVLEVNQSARIDFVLEVGAVTETIEVVAASPVLETNTAQLGTVVSKRQISDLPLNARNFSQLLTLTPGASPVSVSQNRGGQQAQSIGIQTYPAINGQSNRSNHFTLDGVFNSGHFTGTYHVAPSIDALDQFKVQSHSDQAEFGGVTGGVINVATKSGTNEFHGSVFWFLRNDALDARGFFTAGKPSLRQNQFGATVGGPIKRNSTFFFFSYDGYRQNNASSSLTLVPTPEQLNGDFSSLADRAIFDPHSTRTDPQDRNRFLRDRFPGNQIPRTLLSPSIQAWSGAIIPSPNAPGFAGANLRNSEPQRFPADNYSIRGDHQFSASDQVWLRYSWGEQTKSRAQSLPGTRLETVLPSKNFGARYTHIFGPNTLVSGLFGFSTVTTNDIRVITDQALIDEGFFAGMKPAELPESYLNDRLTAPGMSLSGYFGVGARNRTLGPQKAYQGRGDFTHNFGRHSLKIGGEYLLLPWQNIQADSRLTFNSPQSADPNNAGNTGDGAASFVLGVPDRTFLHFPDFELELATYNFYVQDSWRATDKLTINLGLRWNIFRAPSYVRDFPSAWDFNTGHYLSGTDRPGTCSSDTPYGAPCLPTNVDNDYVDQWVDFTGSPKVQEDDFRMVSPRLGLAYRASADTVIRSSFGIFYDLMAGASQQGQHGAIGNANWPAARGVTFQGLNRNFVSVTADAPFGPNPLVIAPSPARIANFTFDPRFKRPYSLQWNFEIQQQLPSQMTLTVGYVGSHNVRLSIGGEYNLALTPGPGPVAPRKLWPHAPSPSYDRSIGQSKYHGMHVKAERRFASGLSYLVSYTWSKSIDVASSAQYRESLSLPNPYDPNSSRSVSSFDVPHLFSGAFVYELPFGLGRRWATSGIGSRILGNWQVNMIMNLRSGQPFTPVMNVDVANIGSPNQATRARPDLVGNPKLNNPSPAEWFDTAALAAPAQFTYGTAGRNILRTDALQNFDFGLFREDQISERVKTQFRAEFFNAFNHPTFGIPQLRFTNRNFGTVSRTISTARQIQFGFKVIF